MFNCHLIIIHILPLGAEIRVDDEIEIQIQGIEAVLSPFERLLEVDVITQKLVAGVIPEQDGGIKLFRFKEEQQAIGAPGIFL